MIRNGWPRCCMFISLYCTYLSGFCERAQVVETNIGFVIEKQPNAQRGSGPKHYCRILKTSELRHDKTNKVSVRQANTQIKLGIRPFWSESSLSPWRNLGPLATHWAPQWRFWSDWADAHADLSFRWAHTHFVGFVISRLKYSLKDCPLYRAISSFENVSFRRCTPENNSGYQVLHGWKMRMVRPQFDLMMYIMEYQWKPPSILTIKVCAFHFPFDEVFIV